MNVHIEPVEAPSGRFHKFVRVMVSEPASAGFL
jgi:hypothetical protein